MLKESIKLVFVNTNGHICMQISGGRVHSLDKMPRGGHGRNTDGNMGIKY